VVMLVASLFQVNLTELRDFMVLTVCRGEVDYASVLVRMK